MYFEPHATIIDDFISTLHSTFLSEYDADTTSKVFGSGISTTIKRSEPKTTWNFFKNIQSHRSNQQGITATNPRPRRANVYYGREPVSTDANDETVFGTKTYSSATQPNKNNAEIVRLTSLVNELSDQVNNLKQTVTKDVTSVVLKDVATKLETFETRVHDRVDGIAKKCETQFEQLGQQYSSILSQMNSNSSHLLAAIQGKQATSSGVDSSARGRGGV